MSKSGAWSSSSFGIVFKVAFIAPREDSCARVQRELSNSPFR